MDFELKSRAEGGGPLRVLIVRVGAMGDVLHGLPALAGLRLAYPDCFVGWAVEPRWRSLLAGGMVDQVHEVPTREWKQRPFSMRTAREVVSLRRALRAERYDVCVDLQGSIRSAVIGRMAGARRLVGPAEPWESQARWLYGERVAVRSTSVIAQACELLGAGVGERLSPGQVVLPMDSAAEEWFARRFPELREFCLIAPGAGWGAKQWPVERFRELAVRLKAAGYRVLVSASSAGDERAAAIGAEVVVSNLRELVALTRRAALVVGGDTGPVHLAAALGVPVVALFGPTDPSRTGPQFPGARTRVLRHAASKTDHRRHRETEAGLQAISVEEVAQAGFALLRGENEEIGNG